MDYKIEFKSKFLSDGRCYRKEILSIEPDYLAQSIKGFVVLEDEDDKLAVYDRDSRTVTVINDNLRDREYILDL